jgi:hypothetical protein
LIQKVVSAGSDSPTEKHLAGAPVQGGDELQQAIPIGKYVSDQHTRVVHALGGKRSGAKRHRACDLRREVFGDGAIRADSSSASTAGCDPCGGRDW